MPKTKITDRAMILTDLNKVLETYADAQSIAFDLETDGLSRYANDIMVVSMAAPGLPTAVLHVAGRVAPELIQLLESKVLIGHNITTFDIPFLAKYGYDISGSAGWVDTMIAEQLCVVSDRRGIAKTLKATAKRRLGVDLEKDVDHKGWSASSLTDDQIRYAAGDVVYLHRVFDEQLKVMAEHKVEDAWETELGAQRATAHMVTNGLPLIVDELAAFVTETQAQMAETKAALEKQAQQSFNPVSSKQVKAVFQKQFGVALPSTDVDTLRKVAGEGGIIGEVATQIQVFRKQKKATLYNKEWVAEHVCDDGRVRASYRQLGTDTGRYSCNSPNLQQFPRNLRNLVGFAEDTGWRILSCDYSQIEILIAAVLCKEQLLIDAVLESDVHTFVASMIFHKPAEEISERERKMAKAASFTLLFAGGALGIIRSAAQGGLMMTTQEAQHIRDQFYGRFPAVANYIGGIQRMVGRQSARRSALSLRIPKGPVRSVFGPSMTPPTVTNTLIQGAASVGLKRALSRISGAGLGKFLCATIHDELLLVVEADRAEEIREIVEQSMIAGMEEVIGIRPKVESKIGLRWG